MTDTWIKNLAGRFLVFDGPDGSGKTTQARRFARFAEARGLDVCQVREPGGTVIGERIRQVLLDREHQMMEPRCEVLLYMASRTQLVAERIRPALARSALVIADRFISSTLAYQGAAGGVPLQDIRRIADLAVGDTLPDLTVIFDVDEHTAAQRLQGTRKAGAPGPTLFCDRIEMMGDDYHARVRRGYLDQAAADPDRHLVIDAADDEQAVFDRLRAALAQRFA